MSLAVLLSDSRITFDKRVSPLVSWLLLLGGLAMAHLDYAPCARRALGVDVSQQMDDPPEAHRTAHTGSVRSPAQPRLASHTPVVLRGYIEGDIRHKSRIGIEPRY
jgi:hypothetical protein